jgi:hypothetical protein
VVDGALTPLLPREEEFAGPLWQLGYTSYGLLADGRLAVTHGRGHEGLSVLDPATGALTSVHDELGWAPYVTTAGMAVASVVASGTVPNSVAVVDVGTLPAEVDVIRASVTDVTAPEGERPPYVVSVHGGPTAHAYPHLSTEYAYFASRGIGIIDVNYGGSTGYGRAYRDRLKGQWGVIDVDDSVTAAQALAEAGEADL